MNSKQLLWKESLDSDGQQFHQYQQNEQSPITLTHWTQKRGKGHIIQLSNNISITVPVMEY